MRNYKILEGVKPTVGDMKLMKRIMDSGNVLEITSMMERYVEVEGGTIDDLDFDLFDEVVEKMFASFQVKNPNSKGQ